MSPGNETLRIPLLPFLCLFFAATTASNNLTFTPQDVLLINCGAYGSAMDAEKRVWQGDQGSKYLPSPARESTTVAVADSPGVPFKTALIFTGRVRYSIPVQPSASKFVRLYFYPAAYGPDHDSSSAVFDVLFGRYTLLFNFTPALEAAALKRAYIVREYSLQVSSFGFSFLSLTFRPSVGHPGSYAFINGIEVISMPDMFNSVHPFVVRSRGTRFGWDPTALETMYHLNVGGGAVDPTGDSGLFRRWEEDKPYIVGGMGRTHTIDHSITLNYTDRFRKYSAPDSVYTTQRYLNGINRDNLTWVLTVDPGFYYLTRLHFCDLQSYENWPREKIFRIYINNIKAEDQAHVLKWATILVGNVEPGSGIGVPFYKDYITYLPNGTQKVDLRLDLQPNEYSKPEFVAAQLNGLEVVKLSVPGSYSLAGVGISPIRAASNDRKNAYKSSAIVGGAVGGLVVVCSLVFVFLAFNKFKRQKVMAQKGLHSKQSNLCRHFTLAEIKEATQGFDDSLILGVGGFGKVYKGFIRTSKSTATATGGLQAAIKRAHPVSQQGLTEFLNEIEMLLKLRHRHLVSLIGFCDEQGEMILVYEFMLNGTLREHLYDLHPEKPKLCCRQRLQICIDAARGLHYLHTGVRHTIIHRDVKSTNILLDESWVAKMADFGLCKVGPEMERRNFQVSTVVKGSFGYLDPEYFRRQKLTDKSDVYSFGVVLFEVLCARPAVIADLPHEQASLAEWARHCYDNGMLENIVDPHLKGQIAPECFLKFIEMANKCISNSWLDRPSMGDVLWSLESALQLQEVFEKELHSSPTIVSCTNVADGTSVGTEGFTSNADVFSELVHPKGR